MPSPMAFAAAKASMATAAKNKEESTAAVSLPDRAENATPESQRLARCRDEDSSTFTSQIESTSSASCSNIPRQHLAADLELQLPISSAVWDFTSKEYINGTDELNPNILKFQPSTLVPVSEDSAAHKVFGTVELLRLILESCTYRDLLCRLPRVNTTWKSIIEESKFIQKNLFFLPWEENDYLWRWGQFNPFMFILAYQPGEESKPPCRWECEKDLQPSPYGDQSCYWLEDRKVLMELNWDRIKKDERFGREGASWRRMLLQQPAIQQDQHIINIPGIRNPIECHWFGGTLTGESKTIGDTWDIFRTFEEDLEPGCVGPRTFIRSLRARPRQHITVETFVQVLISD